MEEASKSRWSVVLLVIISLIVIGNIVILDLWSVQIRRESSIASQQMSYILGQEHYLYGLVQKQNITPTPGSPSASLNVMKITLTPTPTVSSAVTASSLQTSYVKEFFVPLGSGSSNAMDWTDVVGIVSNIDSTQYKGIKSVVFEASVHIPNGNETAYVRLFNSTDKHPVWFSDVSLSGGTPQFLVSQPISLDSGNKQYQVQMKTSLGSTAVLDQARVHIIVN